MSDLFEQLKIKYDKQYPADLVKREGEAEEICRFIKHHYPWPIRDHFDFDTAIYCTIKVMEDRYAARHKEVTELVQMVGKQNAQLQQQIALMKQKDKGQ